MCFGKRRAKLAPLPPWQEWDSCVTRLLPEPQPPLLLQVTVLQELTKKPGGHAGAPRDEDAPEMQRRRTFRNIEQFMILLRVCT